MQYRVELHGPVEPANLQMYLNNQWQTGWRLAGTIAAPATDREPPKVLLIFERVGD